MKTPLNVEHMKLNAKMIDFFGWDLPVQYTSTIEEHQACRKKAALFDVSHMGEIWLEGRDALFFADYLVTNDLKGAPQNKAVYALLCTNEGGVIDDLIVYPFSSDRVCLVVNASRIQEDLGWILSKKDKTFYVSVTNASSQYAQIAIQGPEAHTILEKVLGENLPKLGRFEFAEYKDMFLKKGLELFAQPSFISRTGYTGEDGYEIYLSTSSAALLWQELLRVGTPLGLKPAGLAARDTLRLEKKYPLYGQELSLTTNPLEAGLGWAVKFNKPGFFVGKDALLQIQEKRKSSPETKSSVGLLLSPGGIARPHQLLYADENAKEPIGELTSGSHSPSLGKSIGVGFLPSSLAKEGTKVYVEIRDKKIPAEVVKTPFVKSQEQS